MGLGKLVKKIGKTVGKAIVPKSLSIKGHKFSLNPASMLQGVAGDALQGKSGKAILRGAGENYKAGLRTAAVGAAGYGAAAALPAIAGAAGSVGGALGSAGAAGMSKLAPLVGKAGDLVPKGLDEFGNKIYDTSKDIIETNSPEQLAEWARMDAEAAGGGGGRFRGVGDFLKNNAGTIADLGGAAADAYGAYKQGAQQDELFDREKRSWNERAPLRQAGMAGLMDQSRPDLSSMFNPPEQRYRKVNVGSRGGL